MIVTVIVEVFLGALAAGALLVAVLAVATTRAATAADDELTERVDGIGRKLARLRSVPDRRQLRAELNEAADATEMQRRREFAALSADGAAVGRIHSFLGPEGWRVPLDRHGLDAETAWLLLDHLALHRPNKILYAGRPDVTLLLALGAARMAHGQIVSLHHDAEQARRAASLVEAHDVSHYVDIRCAPPITYRVGSLDLVWHELAESDRDIDLLVIEPPMGSVDPLQRDPAMHVLAPRLSETATVFLPGYDRPEGRRTAHGWCRRHGLHLEREHHGPVVIAELVATAPSGDTSARERYVVVKGRYGMGDRIRAVLSGAAYASRTGRLLVVDWEDGSYSSPHDGDVYRALFAAPESVDIAVERLVGLTVHPPEWQGLLTAYRTRTDGLAVPPNLLSRSPDHDVPDDVVVVAKGPLVDRTSIAALRPSAELLDGVDAFASQWFHGRVLGVHVRHGNGEFLVSPPDLEWFHETIDGYRQAFDTHVVFLATDSAATEDEFRARHGHIISTPKWFAPPGGGSLHQNPDCPDPFQNAVEALTDLWLLARCHALIVGPGAFAEAATALSGLPAGAVEKYPGKVHPDRREKVAWRTIR